MKKITCKAMGGPCDHEMEVDSVKDASKKGWEHVKAQAEAGDAEHQELLKKLEGMPEEVGKQWEAEMQVKLDAAPEV